MKRWQVTSIALTYRYFGDSVQVVFRRLDRGAGYYERGYAPTKASYARITRIMERWIP